jgi:hypothetical protein
MFKRAMPKKRKKPWYDSLYWRIIYRLSRYSEALYKLYMKKSSSDPFYKQDDHW